MEETFLNRKLQCLLPISDKSEVLILDSENKLNSESLYDIVLVNREQNKFRDLDTKTLLNKVYDLIKPGGYLQIDTKNQYGILFFWEKLLDKIGFNEINFYCCLPNNDEPRYIVSLDSSLPLDFYLNVQKENSGRIKLLRLLFKTKIGFYLMQLSPLCLTIVAKKKEEK